MGDFGLLKGKQMFGKKQLEIFKQYGTKAVITDFSILLGGDYYNSTLFGDSKSLKNRTGKYYTRDFSSTGVFSINCEGKSFTAHPFYDRCGVRATFSGNFMLLNTVKKFSIQDILKANGKVVMKCGEFPQSLVNKSLSDELEKEFQYYTNLSTNNGNIVSNMSVTDKTYCFGVGYFPYRKFNRIEFKEYAYKDRKFIRVETVACMNEFMLSDGKLINSPTICWIEVEPIVWLVDEKSKTAITEKIILAGIPFNREKNTLKMRFKDNTIGQYMSKEFMNVIRPSSGFSASINHDYEEEYVEPVEEACIEEKEVVTDDRELAFDFDFSDVSDEEMIEGTISSDIAVFLHGKSSDGKSARVKQIDPDCEIVYLRNATPDSLNGKSVYNAQKGEMIDVPPTWYKKIKEKCEAEPDKLHIVFFDELTNALPSIQGMAFNIILDKEVNGIWKLPSNCRIVAAGNDMNDSLAANEMAEPLFNRFSHVYVNTTVEDWLKWAARKENNIHPAIYAYVAYKSCSRSDVLRTKYDGKRPNADPRKWEMASKVLYSTKNPEMLRALIGKPLTDDFIEFCKHSVITLEDVVNGNYNDEDIKSMNLSEKYATSIGLSKCEEKDLEVVRSFVSKLGAEVLATFDVLVNYKKEEKAIENKQDNRGR